MLGKMNRNKAPGISGFTPEFMQFFWDDIGPIIVDYINDAYRNGLFITQRRGMVTISVLAISYAIQTACSNTFVLSISYATICKTALN